MKRIIITGATRVIGRSLIKTSIEAGNEVLAVVRPFSSIATELEKIEHCRILKLNLYEYGYAIEELNKQEIEPNGFDCFYHLAWMGSFGKDRDDIDLQLENVRASVAAVRFAKALGCKTFVGIGSQAEYGRVEGILSPETPTNPETGYGIAKLCAGQMTRLVCEQLGMRHIWCRVLSVYGPYDRDQTLISTAITRMMHNEETEFTPCDQMWDYIYADDAARAIMLAAEKGENGKVYMVGSGEVHPLKEYIKTIAELTGYSREIGFGKRPYNDKQVMYLQADTKNLHKIGFHPDVSFSDGIRETIKWQKQRDQ